MKEELISVVLPIYNVEKYLERCLNSVVNQTYNNLEIILVDDGSIDSCPQICEDFKKKDDRIKVIHKENAGLGKARNTGIEEATGEYICFFDSDDYIALETIEKAYKLAKSTEADIVTFGYVNIDKYGDVAKVVIPRTKKSIYEGNEVQEKFLPDMIASNPKTGEITNLHMSAWASFYSKSLIEKVNWRFVSEREIISEDIYSLLVLYHSVKKVAVMSEALYFYCENENSLTNTYRKDRYEKIRCFHKSCLALQKELGYNCDVVLRLNEPFISYTIAALKMIVLSGEKENKKRDDVKAIIGDEHLQKVLLNLELKHTNMRKKILYACMKKKWYGICYNLIKLKAKRII